MGLKSPKHEYFHQGNSSKPYQGPKRKKLEIFVFPQISSFLDRLDKNSPEWPKMAPKPPEMVLICYKHFKFLIFETKS